MNFPELPPRHYWKDKGTQIEIFAERTVWSRYEEAVYWFLLPENIVKVWKRCSQTNGDFRWQDYATFDTTQEAIDVMAALCWLGEADYTLLPEEGDGKLS